MTNVTIVMKNEKANRRQRVSSLIRMEAGNTTYESQNQPPLLIEYIKKCYYSKKRVVPLI